MVAFAAAHNRLIDYAIIADLRGDAKAALALRYAAMLLAREINAECAIAAGSRRAKTPKAVECEASQSGGEANRPKGVA